MTRINFDRFEQDFRTASLDCVALLTKNYNALPFYGVCVYADSFDGQFALYANTEAAFANCLQQYRAQWGEKYSNPVEAKKLKYNCGDWEYQTLCQPDNFRSCFERTMKSWCSEIYDLSYPRGGLSGDESDHLQDIACRVALSLASSAELASLNRTHDFSMLVAGHDEPELAAISRLQWFEKHRSLKGFDATRS
jgi:hypothetical protein